MLICSSKAVLGKKDWAGLSKGKKESGEVDTCANMIYDYNFPSFCWTKEVQKWGWPKTRIFDRISNVNSFRRTNANGRLDSNQHHFHGFGFQFGNASEVNMTSKRHHCSSCEKHFSTASYLKLHEATHEGSSSALTCSICEQSFVQQENEKPI